MAKIQDGVTLEEVEIAGTIFYFKKYVGWFDQILYSPESHSIFRMSDKLISATGGKSFDGIMNVAESRLERMRAWLVKWDGVDNPTETDYMNIHPAIAVRIFEKIDQLEEQLEVLPEGNPT